jgi:RNA polymerase sigma-70 factor (ECF subfamily)
MRRLPNERARWLAQNIVPHERSIRSWLGRRTHGLDLDDIIQEMYARLAALESVEDIRNPRQYAAQTAVSITLNMTRHARVIQMIPVSDFEEMGLTSSEPSPERAITAREDLRELRAALQTLPATCRKAFLLRRVEGLSHREIAARLGISTKTVEKYMARSVRFLIETYGRGGKETPDVSMDSNQRPDGTGKVRLGP